MSIELKTGLFASQVTEPTSQLPEAEGSQFERAGVYLFFSRLFLDPPSEEFLRKIVEKRLMTLAEKFHGLGAVERTGWDCAEDPRWPLQSEAIAVEYAHLFAVPGEQSVHPYESAYCDTLAIDATTACSPYFETGPAYGRLTGFLGGPSAGAVQETYWKAGFELNQNTRELPDHLALELEFMSQLITRGAGSQAQDFFRNHLGRWIFRCLDEIRQKAVSGFYRAVADSLAAFLKHEQVLLNEGR